MKIDFDKIIGNSEMPKPIKYILAFIICGAIFTFGVVMTIRIESVIGKILYIIVALFAVAAFVSLCIEIHKAKKY